MPVDPPKIWLDLLGRAISAPHGTYAIPDDEGMKDFEAAAEKMVDAGLLHISRARNYQITDLGREIFRRYAPEASGGYTYAFSLPKGAVIGAGIILLLASIAIIGVSS